MKVQFWERVYMLAHCHAFHPMPLLTIMSLYMAVVVLGIIPIFIVIATYPAAIISLVSVKSE